MPKIPELLEMLKAGMHFGHQTSRWHPKMKPYIFGVRNSIHIIDLEQTSEKLEEALKFIKETVKTGGVVLFLGTKPQAQEIVQKAAIEVAMPYIVHRWLGGTLTNYSQIKRVIERYNKLRQEKEKGELAKYTKKEQSLFDKEIEHLEQVVGGLADLKKMPDALFIVDLKHESTAVAEANKKHLPIVAICDTNCNPEMSNYPIPSNDDGIKSIEMIVGLVVEAVKEGKADIKPEEKKDLVAEKKEEKKDGKAIKS